jgi:hypothetical protein
MSCAGKDSGKTPALTNAQQRADQYRREAIQCREQAERSNREEDKASWLKLAAQWQGMAEEADPSIRSGLQRVLEGPAENKVP